MDPDTEILEISSDEDVGWEEPSDTPLDWISEFFGTVEKITDESDDVVVVSEVSVREVSGSSALQKQSCKPLDAVKSAIIRDDLDDECLILDGDPDKPVSVVDDPGNGSDELLIVGEKGQIACRDYPHSRHLCATFVFSTTPHEKYCDLCHCYVCDSLAPCVYWGTGASSMDHCHSTDKEEVWRIQRDYFKQGKTAPSLSHKLSETNLPSPQPLHKSGPALIIPEPHNCASVQLHTLSKSNPLRACTSATSFGMPSIISHKNNQLSGSNLSRNRFPHRVSRSHPIRATNNNTRRVRSNACGSLGPHFVSTQSNFKRVGSVGSVSTNQYGYGSSSNSNPLHISLPHRNRCPPVISHDDVNSRSNQDLFTAINAELGTCRSSSQPDMGTSFIISSQPQVHSQPIPQSNENPDSAPNTTNPSSLDYDFSWLNVTTTQSLTPTTENAQLPSVQPPSEPLPVTEPVPPCPEGPNPSLTDFDLDNWFCALGHQPVSATPEDAVPSDLDFVSTQAQADLVNAEMLLFDFENS